MRTLILGGLIALALGVGAAVVLEDEESSWTFGPDSSLPPSVATPPSDPAPAKMVREALRVVRRDGVFRGLTADGRAKLVSTSEWWGVDHKPLGARLTFTLREAIKLDADLPVADIPPDAPTEGECDRPYRQTWLHESSDGVSQLRILVDLRLDRVADIDTNAKSGRRSWVEDRAHPTCRAVQSG
jgi:hypothetical protein